MQGLGCGSTVSVDVEVYNTLIKGIICEFNFKMFCEVVWEGSYCALDSRAGHLYCFLECFLIQGPHVTADCIRTAQSKGRFLQNEVTVTLVQPT